ncbi:MAG: tripartite tricarboxylate transporter permease [Betaproteobacteria bacterium]|nr:tripartite tricarboxylate transporter permease [Betaproteobacteria bacterium]MBV9360976.1 tripartite tricarboxylate transporter permease [Betaproteobacteria bacterium]
MLDAFIQGLLLVLQWKAFVFMLAGIFVGFWVGLLPGLGGATTLALMLPFIYNMQPVEAFAFLLGMHSVVATTGDITSILFGVPGEATTAAIILDGHAMAKRGEAGRALGAALASSFVGALIGAAALALAIPIVRPLVLTFGSPELFMLAIVGLAFIASLSAQGARGMVRGFLAGGLGLFLAMVGQDPQAGVARYTLDTLYLWQGLDLVPVLVGLFAIPEIIDLVVRGTSIAGNAPAGRISKGVFEGVKDVFRNWWLTVRCGLIGTFIGLTPGLGGAVAQWMAYGHATQSARTAEERKGFGQGDVRGVIGPGAACNSKEGGALIPTIAFGVPGGASMAILLGGFFLLGLVPGPDMLTKHLPVTFSLVWTIVIANIITVVACFLLLNRLTALTNVQGHLLVPVVLVLVFIGSYTSNSSYADILVSLIFGALGYFMVVAGWPRAPLVLGLVLGKIAENYLYISVARYDFAWLGRPVVVVLLIIAVGVILFPAVQAWRSRRAHG